MSAASLKVLKGQIQRNFATLDTIDTWETKKVVTAAEANEARAYWHELWDPAPTPESTPEPPAPSETGEGTATS